MGFGANLFSAISAPAWRGLVQLAFESIPHKKGGKSVSTSIHARNGPIHEFQDGGNHQDVTLLSAICGCIVALTLVSVLVQCSKKRQQKAMAMAMAGKWKDEEYGDLCEEDIHADAVSNMDAPEKKMSVI